MELRNQDGDLFSLNLLETNERGDLRFEIAVACGRYAACQNVWITSAEWQSFLGQIKLLEASRQGAATLCGATTNELILNFKSIDKSGHLALEGRVGGRRYTGGYSSNVGLQFGFAFDPGMLAEIARGFCSITPSN